MVHPILKVVNITGQPVGGAEVTLYTLNPTSRLASLALANPSTDLVQDLNFTTNDLLIGSTVNETVAIGPKDGNLVLTSVYTNQDGFARFNITAGIYLINVIKIYTGYSNVISHLRNGWAETLKLKPEKNPGPEPDGPYEYAINAAASGTVIDIRLTYLIFGILFVTAAIILEMTSRHGLMERNDSSNDP
jgi:hypothetical protein